MVEQLPRGSYLIKVDGLGRLAMPHPIETAAISYRSEDYRIREYGIVAVVDTSGGGSDDANDLTAHP